MKYKILPLALMLAVLVSTGLSAQTLKQHNVPVSPKQVLPVHRVVIQLSTSDTIEQKAMMNNLKNLKDGWGDRVAIEVVVHGPGIEAVMKQKSTQQESIQKMMVEGVRFVVCRNTMKNKNVTEDQILPHVGFVPMGVGEVITKQEMGWSYLKAGF